MKRNGVIQIIICGLCMLLPNVPGFIYFLDPKFKESLEWYNSLNLPSGKAPDYLFGPVWFFLYCSMGLAHYLVYHTGDGWFNDSTKIPTISYIVQLLLVRI